MKHAAAEILREYGPFPGVSDIGGVSFDGGRVWLATGERIAALDPDSGEIVGGVDVPADAGTAFDGTHLYQIAEAVIRKVDPQTGEVLATIPAPGKGGDFGLTWAEGSLWVGEYRAASIHQVDPATGEILRTIKSDRFVTGVTWVEGELWHATWQDDASDLRRIDPASGAVLEQLDMPAGIGISGLESDGGGRFFAGGGQTGKLRAIRRPGHATAA